MNIVKNKIIVIVGPTASGKTGLAVKLANYLDGEIVSADSRQVYKRMDIGTGKDLDEYILSSKKIIRHHLIDVVFPNTEFSLAKFYKLADRAIADILGRGKLPIIAGGTGLYAQALVERYDLSVVGPDKSLREKLEKKSIKQLILQLRRLDSEFVSELHESDLKNKRRLIRYIEIRKSKTGIKNIINNSDYEFLVLGIKWPREVLHKRISKRLVERLEKENMIKEVERLHKENRVSWKRLESFGLEYKYISLYLRKKLSYDEMVEELDRAIRKFAKRQMSWYRRWERQGREIFWVKSYSEAKRLTKEFIK